MRFQRLKKIQAQHLQTASVPVFSSYLSCLYGTQIIQNKTKNYFVVYFFSFLKKCGFRT